MKFRQATFKDSENIASLHARSWQHVYRGILNENYLDKDVVSEKQECWRRRLIDADNSNLWVLIAQQNNKLYGFSCIFLNNDRERMAYMDNLHVAPEAYGIGIGRQLLYLSLHHVYQDNPQAGLYLWVFENNANAIAFYLAQGAKIIDNETQAAPGGGTIKALKMAWADLNSLFND